MKRTLLIGPVVALVFFLALGFAHTRGTASVCNEAYWWDDLADTTPATIRAGAVIPCPPDDTPTPTDTPTPAPTATPTPVPAGISLVAHIGAASTNTNGFTTGVIDTTGASLIVLVLADNDGSSALSDSRGNTWVSAVGPSGVGPRSRIFYATNPNVGAGHTFTVTASGKSPSLFVLAFSGAGGPLSASGAGSLFGSTIQPGAASGQLVVTGAAYTGTAPLTITGGFAISDQLGQANSQHFGGGAAWFVAGGASVNPTWGGGSFTGATSVGFGIAP